MECILNLMYEHCTRFHFCFDYCLQCNCGWHDTGAITVLFLKGLVFEHVCVSPPLEACFPCFTLMTGFIQRSLNKTVPELTTHLKKKMYSYVLSQWNRKNIAKCGFYFCYTVWICKTTFLSTDLQQWVFVTILSGMYLCNGLAITSHFKTFVFTAV